MRQSFKNVWVMTGLVWLGAMIAAGHESRAGITITGGFTPATSDPPYDYIFDVYLNPGSSIKFGDKFTVDNLVGVTLLSLPTAQQPENPLAVIWAPSINQSWWTPYPYSSNVTWTFLGLSPYTNPSTSTATELIGQFEIETTVNFPNGPPVPAGTSISYSYTIGGVTTNDTLHLQDLAVPEPSSSTIVLLIGGTAALSGLVVRARRRRAARPA